MGSAAVASVPALSQAVTDSESIVRVEAVGALIAIQPNADPQIHVLMTELLKGPEQARYRAGYNLGFLGEKADEATNALIVALDDESRAVRQHAARALGMIGPRASCGIEKLTALLQDPSKSVRIAAEAALERINPGDER
jgi:HEAT repeat protein